MAKRPAFPKPVVGDELLMIERGRPDRTVRVTEVYRHRLVVEGVVASVPWYMQEWDMRSQATWQGKGDAGTIVTRAQHAWDLEARVARDHLKSLGLTSFDFRGPLGAVYSNDPVKLVQVIHDLIESQE